MTTTLSEATRRHDCMPVLSVEDAVHRVQQMARFVSDLMRSGTDYGVIPGSTKPTLLKPGAEKLCTLFGLTVEPPAILTEVEDWTGRDHGGEPFFYYKVLQSLSKDGRPVASQFASCNSWEVKYRWRQSERVCPSCGKPAIIKGKADFGGGYLCFGKKGGCGAKFKDGDASIEGQRVGRVPNPDVCDLVNTLQKMAEKRALVAAALIATNASEFFTQDMEDLIPEAGDHHAQAEVVRAEAKPRVEPARQLPAPRAGGNANGRHREPEAPAESWQDRQAREADEVFPTQTAPARSKLWSRLEAKDAELAAAGRCEPGSLVAFLLRANDEREHPLGDPETWSGGGAVAWAAERVKAFESDHPAPEGDAAEPEAPAAGKLPDRITPKQAQILAAELGRKGVTLADLCRRLDLPPVTLDAMPPATWTRLAAAAQGLPDPAAAQAGEESRAGDEGESAAVDDVTF